MFLAQLPSKFRAIVYVFRVFFFARQTRLTVFRDFSACNVERKHSLYERENSFFFFSRDSVERVRRMPTASGQAVRRSAAETARRVLQTSVFADRYNNVTNSRVRRCAYYIIF